MTKLFRTVFDPKPGERIAILIDLENPKSEMAGFAFLKHSEYKVQRHAYETFYMGLKNGALAEMELKGGEIFAYRVTGGSNLDMPRKAYAPDGWELDLVEDVYKKYDLVICISTYSATAPLTEFAKQYGFRGATMHGMNDIILQSGLAVDYVEVSKSAEKLRLGMTKADWVEIDYEFFGKKATLHLELAKQEAQKSHGLCRESACIANLPAGEVYFVPTGAEGSFPLQYEDGTIGIMQVTHGRIVQATLVRGNAATIDEHNQKLRGDPVTGELGELGFGTQMLPFSGSDIQDEKILGTMHVATGRSDHLGGSLTPGRFTNPKHATHDDILFAPHKTPDIRVPQVRMKKDGKVSVVIENYKPASLLRDLLALKP